MIDLTELLSLAVERKASDVHVAPGRSPSFRLDGSIWAQQSDFPALTQSDTKQLLYSILRDDQKEILDQKWEIDLSSQIKLPGGETRVRVNMHRQQNGLAAVFRLIADEIPSPEEITMEESVKQLASLPRGLVLLTGPTGSGKSTTLACLIDLINQRYRKHILTIEDPIEYLHRGKLCTITQRELGTHTHAFAPALKSALRVDPDVILVGEMRDLETIQLALTASETGHLVFSTLHTTDASLSVDRVIDVFPAGQQQMVRLQLAGVLQAVVTQVLLPRQTGKGRIAAREILLANPAVRTLIRENNTHQIFGLLTSNVKAGMCPLELSLAVKVRQKLITEEEAFSVANRPTVLQSYLESKNLVQEAPGLAANKNAAQASSNPPDDW